MYFLDYSILCADIMTTPATPTYKDELNDLVITNAMFDDVYITKDMNEDIESSEIPSDWNFDTIFHAKFDDVLVAGDVDFMIRITNGFLIKRRDVDDFKWTTIAYFPVNTPYDFKTIFQDRTAALGKEYEYAFVPLLNGMEGTYSTDKVVTSDNMLVILDRDEIWSTSITDGFCDTTRTYPINMLTTLNSKYPTSVRNTMANYDVINVSGTWLPNASGSECELIDINNSINIGYMTKWSKSFIDFLTNDNDKLLKNVDGRMWLCHLSSDVTDSADTIYNNRKLGFTMTEVGNVSSSEDLCDAGLISPDTEPYW